MKSNQNFSFANSQAPQIQRSSFNRSFSGKTSFDADWLVPFFWDEVLPGDIFNAQASLFARLPTLKTPIMDNLWLDMFFFFVPNRLVWEHWEQFMGARPFPGASIDYEVPSLTGSETFEFDQGSIFDHFGLPTKKDMGTTHVNALPLRAYNLIYNEWFRDENLMDPASQLIDDGPDLVTEYELQKRGKRFDYFTSCLLTPQKGDAVELPLGTTAPVIGDGFALGLKGSSDRYLNYNNDTGFNGILGVTSIGGAIGGTPSGSVPTSDVLLGLNTDPTKSHVYADLTAATSATINAIRDAIAVQHLLELDNRSGTRYTEILTAQWGQNPQDFRLQRPEYLGGNSVRMGVTQVAQTSESATTKQGTLAAYGQTTSFHRWGKSFVEHGHVIGLVNIRADLTYQQGLERMWSRRERYDFPHPVFAHLGEQAVLRQEIYFDDVTPANNTLAFGYQERYAEMRFKNSPITGLFRSNATGTLDFWHLSQNFATNPLLDQDFIESNVPLDRVIAVPSEPHCIMDYFFSYRCARQLPMYGTPGLNRF